MPGSSFGAYIYAVIALEEFQGRHGYVPVSIRNKMGEILENAAPEIRAEPFDRQLRYAYTQALAK